MTRLQFVEIDATPANVADMMTRGHFHAHQDGRWRYSPFGGETVHVNDPSEHFDAREAFANNRAAAVCKSLGLVAYHYADGTRGLWRWDAMKQAVLDQLYGFRDQGERDCRAWVAATDFAFSLFDTRPANPKPNPKSRPRQVTTGCDRGRTLGAGRPFLQGRNATDRDRLRRRFYICSGRHSFRVDRLRCLGLRPAGRG